jgi:DNA-binding transcriptional MerR regulator
MPAPSEGKTMPTTTETTQPETAGEKSARETWLDWLPHSTDAITREQFVELINEEDDLTVTSEQLQSWEERGVLPLPIQGSGYPHYAVGVIRLLVEMESQNGESLTPEAARVAVRAVARVAAKDQHRDVQDVLAQAGEAARQESWIDWVPGEGREAAVLDAEPLLTRDEFIAKLKDGSVDVTPRELTRWQSLGVIPYPQKKRYRGKVRGVYPQWAVSAIHKLRDLQDQGYELREIGPILRDHIYLMFMSRPQTPQQQRDHDRRLARRELFPLAGEIEDQLRTLARVHERIRGGRVVRIDVCLVKDDGSGFTYPFLVSDGGDAAKDDEQNAQVDMGESVG